MPSVKHFIKKVIETSGYTIVPVAKASGQQEYSKDMEEDFLQMYQQCKPYTMTSMERMYGLYKAVTYIVQARIPGDFVECGVWKGGSSMLMALTLLKLGVKDRQLFLYDTFAGMSEPTEKDKTLTSGQSAMDQWKAKNKTDHNQWCFSPLEEVKKSMFSTGYPPPNDNSNNSKTA